MDKNSLPIVYSNKSNLITNYKAINIHPTTRKPNDVRFRGSMFVNMLNNIKHSMINRSQKNRKVDTELEKENCSKISLQVKNYYVKRNISHQKYMPISNSIICRKQDRLSLYSGKTFHTRGTRTRKNLQLNKYSQKILMEEFYVSPNKSYLWVQPEICGQAKLHRRSQFHELPDPDWSILIPLSIINHTKNSIQKFQHLFSQMLFEGIDPIICIKSQQQYKKLPAEFRQLCHILQPSEQIKKNCQFIFIKSRAISEECYSKQANFASRVLCLESLENHCYQRWIYCFQGVQCDVGYMRISDLSKIKNVWVDNQTKYLKFQYQGKTTTQIQTCSYQQDKKLQQILKFQQTRLNLQKHLHQSSSIQPFQKSITILQNQLKNHYKNQTIKIKEKQLEKNKYIVPSNPRLVLKNRQGKNQGQEVMQFLQNHPKRLFYCRNPQQLVSELCRNNGGIHAQIWEFLKGNQNVRGFLENLENLRDLENLEDQGKQASKKSVQEQSNQSFMEGVLAPINQNLDQ